ncbi:polar amino acid transport system substrate-binding protein [Peptoclostridium litorale DSM 5388]|uniref:histidine kinase n=1 Tax=Peptoclostridium litorale DSM 5388 TaxID=1121324 RepID=A0A069RJ57_PEPLI|nr:transporter substrate-binding domain-containing protein [Peptoclostridium litorale]KDR96155.1 sensor protein ZraS [Peptoclostridium litorale DSM 5388]SIO03397.1 polar amino acid transport system substrate-binding protein [Peptoclostridium litorale DSM 5388]
MNKKTYAAALVILIIIVNLYVNLEYDKNIIELINEDHRLSVDEELWIENHGDIVYCSDYNSPPLRYIDSENGQYQGVIVDYMNALSINLETKIKIRPEASWNKAYESVKNGDADCIDMIGSPARSLSFNFSKPIYKLRGTAAFIRGKEDVRRLSDLKGKSIAVQASDYAVEFLMVNALEAHIVQTQNMSEALLKLKMGEVDIVVGDEPVIKFTASELGIKNSIGFAEKPLYEENAVLAVPKSQKELLSILNKSISELEKRNTMEKIQEKWFGAYSITGSQNREKAFSILLSSVSALAVISYMFYIWNNQLKKEVEKRTMQLNSSKNDLIATFDGFTDYMVVVDKTGKVVLANESLCGKIRESRDYIIGKNYENSIDFPCWEYAKRIIRGTFKNGLGISKEYRCGKSIFSVNTFPISENSDEIQRVLTVIKDVTSIKVSEKMLLHEDKMVAVGQLAGGVAHEIRNPLGIIRSHAYLIKMNPYDGDKISESAAAIEVSVERASGIIENLLNFSRLTPNTVANTNIKSLIKSIFKLYTKPMQQKGIQHEVTCSDELECSINQESLKHVLMNLVSNAIDSIEKRGSIEAVCDISEDNLIIEVRDTGYGIKKEDVESIFTPFFTTKAPGKGTGLGLYVVYSEVNKCGGEISVDSKYGEGSTFKVSLPIK